jgi:hypothetical protein
VNRRILLFVLTTLLACDSYTVRSEELDLGLIVGHLKQVEDADASKLEEWINETPGVNVVDADKDGSRDLITITEQGGPGSTLLLLVAHPKSHDPIALAELKFEKRGDDTIVSAVYTSRVVGGQNDQYQETVGRGAFAAWLWTPRPVYVNPISHYDSYSWAAPRPTLRVREVASTRTTTEVRVAPVSRARPVETTWNSEPVKRAKVEAPRRAEQTPSTSLSSSANKGSNFFKRSDDAPRPKATNVTRTSPAPSAPKPASTLPSRPARASTSSIKSSSK